MENLQKNLIKLLAKAYCRKNNFMNCFDKWFDATYNNKYYIPFLKGVNQTQISEKENSDISKDSRAKRIKSKKRKKSKKEIQKTNSDEIENNNNKKSSERNSLSSITNNISKDLINSKDIESNNISIDNNSTNTNVIKNKLSDSKSKKKIKLKEKKEGENKSKHKKSKKKEKNIKDEEEAPNPIKNQMKNANLEAKKEFRRNIDYYSNVGKDNDPKMELKALGIELVDSDNNTLDKKSSDSISKDKKIKKKKRHHHKRNDSGTVNLISEENMESIENLMNDLENNSTNIENLLNSEKNYLEEDNNNKINKEVDKIKEITNLKSNLKGKNPNEYNSVSEINPDVMDIEIIQAEDNKKKYKKIKKDKSKKGNDEENDKDKSNDDINSVDIDKRFNKEERKLIKKYKKALHKLRVVIRGYRKRKKEEKTFNPDLEMKRFFQKWILETFPQGLEQFRDDKNSINEKNDNISNRNKINKHKKSKKSRI